MEEFRGVELETTDANLNEKIVELNYCYFRAQKVFAKVCYKVYDIFHYCQNNCFWVKEQGYDRLVKYRAMDILGKFGLSRKVVSQYVCCYRKFIIASSIDDAVVSPMFESYSPGRLFRMLPYSYDMLCLAIKNKDIYPEMSCDDISRALKDLSGRTDKSSKVYEAVDDEVDDSDDKLLEAYDPQKSHDLSYFKQFDKASLIDFLFMAEDYIKKLSKKKK